ncbi:hypothetical protein Tco_1407562 [Tanacetum coccineum]
MVSLSKLCYLSLLHLEVSLMYLVLYLSNVHGAESRVHTPAHSGSEALNGPPDSVLSHKPKPLGKHRPPPL